VTEEHVSDELHQAIEAFIAELRHWREVAGFSQKALASQTGYTPSYVSKVESGSLIPSRQFAESADRALHAGNALVRRWKDLHAINEGASAGTKRHEQFSDDPQSAPSTSLVVEHEDAKLTYDNGIFRTVIRRQLRNVGIDPVTRYLIRIAVDRFPGDPERSNQLYRAYPLTWEEIGLRATCRDEPMAWLVKHDRDAFKELWLLFENDDGRYPLYPGEVAWIEYSYTVSADKWGPWWQRAIRLPTRRLSLCLDFPATLQPVVWGMETSMTAEASSFRTPIVRDAQGDRVYFNWSTDDPPLHARYRVEWKFKAPTEETVSADQMSPSERMTTLGIVQEGDPILQQPARRFDLPAEAEDARRVIAQLVSTLERVSQVHTFAKGMGLAAPQIGIGRAAALVRTPGGDSITFLNPRIIGEAADTDDQYEGCLSFFDVRGLVPRPLRIEVEHQTTEGELQITSFDHGLARLVAHEIDHLQGILYRSRMHPGTRPIPVADYKGTGHKWRYEGGRLPEGVKDAGRA
jgi:peptide deformylase